MKKLHIYLLSALFIFYQSCIVIGTNNGSRWFKKEQTLESVSIDTIPKVIISLERHKAKLVIPFVFFEWYNKNYNLSFNFSTLDNTYKNIDSIRYSILDIDSNLIYKNNCIGNSFSIFSNSGVCSSIYRVEIETDYKLIISKKNKNDLILIFNLYLHKNTGEKTVLLYHCTLKKCNDKWLDAGFFRV